MTILFSIISVVLFFVAGDEISWGQRIFDLQTPQGLATINNQNELTVHNIDKFEKYVAISYILIGLYGSIMWLIRYFIPPHLKSLLFYFIPPWFCSVYFFSGFAFNYYILTHEGHQIGVWSEPAELMLHLGIMFTLLAIFIKEKHIKM